MLPTSTIVLEGVELPAPADPEAMLSFVFGRPGGCPTRRSTSEHRHVYWRGLVGCVDAESRRNLWRLARTALAGSAGALFLELAASSPAVPVHAPAAPPGLLRRLDPFVVVREIEAYSGRVVAREEGPGEDLFDHLDPWTCWLQVTFDTTVPGGTPHV